MLSVIYPNVPVLSNLILLVTQISFTLVWYFWCFPNHWAAPTVFFPWTCCSPAWYMLCYLFFTFFCFTSASSNLFCPHLSFSPTFYGSTLLLHHCSSILFFYSFFPSPLVSSPVSSPVLFSGEEGFSQWEPRALIPSFLPSSVFCLTSSFPPLSFALPMRLSLSLSLCLTVTWIVLN